jgi:UDPglucose 6-dehydrogenase
VTLSGRVTNEPRITFADNQTAALEGADALIIVTDWRD